MKPHNSNATSILDAYERANEFLRPEFNRGLPGAELLPFWSADGTRLFYRRYRESGSEFVEFDLKSNIERTAFDHTAVARLLERQLGIAATASALPFSVFEPVGTVFRFNLGEHRVEFDPKAVALRMLNPAFTAEGSCSPDQLTFASVRRGNVHLSLPESTDIALTRDAEAHHAYDAWPESNLAELSRRAKQFVLAPPIGWSPDSRYFAIHRLDERQVKPLHLLQSVLDSPHDRPIVHSYRYALPIDRERPWSTLHLVDVSRRTIKAIDMPALETVVQPPIPGLQYQWAEDSSAILLLHWSQGRRRLVLYRIDPLTATAHPLLEEQAESIVRVTHVFGARPNMRYLPGTDELIWYSERSGWGHLYLLDASTGAAKNPITQGEWLVDTLLHVDPVHRRIYFSARGRESRRDLYERYIYRVNFDGSDLRLLTPEPGDHRVQTPTARTSHTAVADEIAFNTSGFSPDGEHFVSTLSSATQAPVSMLRRAEDGAIATELMRADVGALVRRGWRPAQRLELRGRDGETPVFATLWPPHNLNPDSRYPLIDIVYPGPFVALAPAVFTPPHPTQYFNPEALCALGFAVVMIDGLGTPFRSRNFSDFAHGNLQDAGLADHVAAFAQIQKLIPWCDTTRIGVIGSSAGGFAAARAMFSYPEIFKAGISMCGAHDLRMYHAAWAEIFQGYSDRYKDVAEAYAQASNLDIAHQLQGKLLIAHGDLDDNVHPALSIRLIDRLIAANKDFEFILLPNRGHMIKSDLYLMRRCWDFFVRHLLNQEPPKEFCIH